MKELIALLLLVPWSHCHKPLLKLFGDRCLEDIPNPRLRNLKERTLRYLFRMVYIPGTRNLTSDALSRHPSGTKTPTRLHLPDDPARTVPPMPSQTTTASPQPCAQPSLPPPSTGNSFRQQPRQTSSSRT